MTCTLILMRHAKSSWDDPRLDDFDRTLNDRGRKSATALGKWLVEKNYRPDQALVSASKRTAETWERVSAAFPAPVTVAFSERLYHSTPEQLLSELQSAIEQTVLLIAHNPGIADFAARIVKQPPSHGRFHDYPTGATTVIRFPVPNWAETGWKTGEVADFTIPRELTD